MSAIETRGKQKSDAVDSGALNFSCTDPGSRLPPPDTVAVENFSIALNRRASLPAGADLCDDHLFELLAQLPWPDGTQGPAPSVNDATPHPASAASSEMCRAAASQLPLDAKPGNAQSMNGQHLAVQGCSPDTAFEFEVTLRMGRKISRKTMEIDDNRLPDAPPAMHHFTPQSPAAVEVAAPQATFPDSARSELKMQEFHQLVSQIGAQVAIDSRRSEVAVSLTHAMFSSTRLRIRGDKDSIEVGYECGSAEETDWFGSNADALVQRLSTSLQRRVTVRPVADHSAT